MDQILKNNKIFQSSHLLLLIGNSLMSSMLIFETIRVGWEIWAAVLIFFAVIVTWVLHIRQIATHDVRMWIYGFIMMVTFFFYGVHPTSTFDMIAIMSASIILFVMTGMRGLINMAQITYYVTMIYNLTDYFLTGGF